MACRFVVMASFKDGAAERIICRDIDMAFVREDAGFDLPIGEAGTEGEGNILVHRLESLEDEGVTRGGGFDTVGEGGVDEIDKE